MRRDYHYPEVVIFSLDFKKVTDYEEQGDLDGYIDYLLEGIRCLKKAGAEFIVIAANSPHLVFDPLVKQAGLPMISIVEVTANEARRLGLKKLLLMGIKFTMESPFYADIFNKYGMDVITPGEEHKEEIDRIVFNELVIGVFRPESRRILLEIIESYPVDGVILGCTELSLFIGREDTKLPMLNTLDLHAQAALDYALED
jgi:aspartate racemase